MSDIPQDHVRLFVACEVPDDVKEAIGETIEGLRKKSGPAVRWIKPEGVHVTLKFLGEVPVRKLPAVKLAIQEAVGGHRGRRAAAGSAGARGECRTGGGRLRTGTAAVPATPDPRPGARRNRHAAACGDRGGGRGGRRGGR